MIDLLKRMYDDIAPKQMPVKVMEALAKMNFGGVLPETSKVILDFMKNSLM